MSRLEVHSAQIRYVKANMPDAIDVSRLGAWLASKEGLVLPGELFAPSWRLLKACKAGEIESFAHYERIFLNEIRARYRQHRHLFDVFLQRRRAVCHRRIVRAHILPALGAIDCGEVVRECVS